MKTTSFSLPGDHTASPAFAKAGMWLSMMVCVAALGISGCRSEAPAVVAEPDQPASDVDASTTGSVTIEIVSPETEATENETEDELMLADDFDVAEGATVEDVMKEIQSPEIVIVGSGLTAFIQSIDGVETDGSRGWTYTIDGEFATEGIGSTEVTPGQTIRWQFTTLEEAMSKE
ncbi:DUF4430 domain-containing protein [Aporhodopirellula aestuarii]|uniref:DUF4430 domain-containing protein n=1 Tax=Aporhodopirellula aestuarii TaxID=2950107 RepID=A0ABT0U4B4_9BACT|nr:DUF4430 domain-containing protein [Aporhodopirellula aestuarii]MCM2371742.1 DUF4430 domain-containing protein [Aporhodopirellula aestuarii]